MHNDETGLYYYGARYYNPVLGKFISPDTIVPDYTNPQSLNRYSYAMNNPLYYTDPTGNYYVDGVEPFNYDDYGYYDYGYYGGGNYFEGYDGGFFSSGYVGGYDFGIPSNYSQSYYGGSYAFGANTNMGSNPVNIVGTTGLVQITAQQGQQIADAAANWKGTPYVTGGKTKEGADCSGAVCGIYAQAGFPYTYKDTSTFPESPLFTPVDNPQVGDVGLYPGHMVIYDPNAGENRDVWSASHPGGRTFGPANSNWYEGSVQWYRYKEITTVRSH